MVALDFAASLDVDAGLHAAAGLEFAAELEDVTCLVMSSKCCGDIFYIPIRVH